MGVLCCLVWVFKFIKMFVNVIVSLMLCVVFKEMLGSMEFGAYSMILSFSFWSNLMLLLVILEFFILFMKVIFFFFKFFKLLKC